MFNIIVNIHGLFRTPDVDSQHLDPEEILDMAHSLVKPSMFKGFDWEIIDADTQEVLVSWDSAESSEQVSQVIWDALGFKNGVMAL